MKKIEKYEELKDEIRLSKQRIIELELLIKEDIQEINESLNPVTIAGRTVKNFVSAEKSGVVSETIGLTVDAFIKRILFKKSNWMLKLAVAFIAKNYAINMVSANSETFVHWLKSKFIKRKGFNGEFRTESSTANVEWDN